MPAQLQVPGPAALADLMCVLPFPVPTPPPSQPHPPSSVQDVEVCWNDCVAFTDGLADATSCPVCNTARRHPKLGVKRLHETSIRTGLTRLFSQPSLVQHMRWAREGFAAEPGRLNSWLCGARVAAVRAELEAKGDTFFSDPDATNIVLALFLDGFNPHKDGTYSLTALCAMVLSLPPWVRGHGLRVEWGQRRQGTHRLCSAAAAHPRA